MNNVKEIDFNKKAKEIGRPKYANGNDFILGAWFSPDPNEKLWQWYKESGLNEITIFPSNYDTEEYIYQALNYCKKYDINAHILMDGKTNRYGKDWPELLKEYKEIITGFDLFDEPTLVPTLENKWRIGIDSLINVIDWCNANYPRLNFTTTFWPNYATKVQIGLNEQQTYEDYVKYYCDTILSRIPEGTRKWLGTDFYPYYKDRFDGTLLNNLEVLQKFATQYGADVYLYIQTMNSIKLKWRLPNRQELSMQYYIALAYGVKNIQMFCFQQPGPEHGFGYEDGSAMITDGYTKGTDLKPIIEYQRTQVYYDIKDLNREITKLKEAFLDFKWKGVLTVFGINNNNNCDDFKMLSYTLNSYDGIESATADENTIIGCFVDGNKNNGYMITNYTNPIAMKDSYVNIKFKNVCCAIVYKNGQKYEVNLINNCYITKIKGGEGQFVIPV